MRVRENSRVGKRTNFKGDFDSAARRLNTLNESYRHSNKFSTHLDGRFYENCSMDAHTKKQKQQKLEKKAKRKKEAIVMRKREEQRIAILEEKLAKKERVKKGATLLQSHFHRRRGLQRVNQIREDNRKMGLVVLFFQSRWRAKLGKKIYSLEKARVMEAKLRKCSVLIQKVARGRILNGMYVRERHREIANRGNVAAQAVQRVWRGDVGRRRFAKALLAYNSSKAVQIQKMVRGKRGRKLRDARVLFLEQMKLIEEEKKRTEQIKFDAACKIQSLTRTKTALRIVLKMAQERREISAGRIQRVVRGGMGRKKARTLAKVRLQQRVKAEKEARALARKKKREEEAKKAEEEKRREEEEEEKEKKRKAEEERELKRERLRLQVAKEEAEEAEREKERLRQVEIAKKRKEAERERKEAGKGPVIVQDRTSIVHGDINKGGKNAFDPKKAAEREAEKLKKAKQNKIDNDVKDKRMEGKSNFDPKRAAEAQRLRMEEMTVAVDGEDSKIAGTQPTESTKVDPRSTPQQVLTKIPLPTKTADPLTHEEEFADDFEDAVTNESFSDLNSPSPKKSNAAPPNEQERAKNIPVNEEEEFEDDFDETEVNEGVGDLNSPIAKV